MKTIPSFTIDHIHLLRGIYVSRKDQVGGEVVTTFDIRMKEPNREPVLGQGAIHTIEHLAATYLRNQPQWADRIIYWGPMGCLTGNYLLMRGDLQSEDIVELMKETFRFVADFEGEVPGAAPKDLWPTLRARCRVLPRKTVATICCTTYPWPSGSRQSTSTKYWKKSLIPIFTILNNRRLPKEVK